MWIIEIYDGLEWHALPGIYEYYSDAKTEFCDMLSVGMKARLTRKD